MIKMDVYALLGWKRGHRWAVLMQPSSLQIRYKVHAYQQKHSLEFMCLPLNIKGAFGSKRNLSRSL